MRAFFLAVAFVVFANPVFARDIAGVQVEEQMVNAAGSALQLNGAGIRTKFFFKIYIAELYLENPLSKAENVIADEGAKLVRMHFLYDEVGSDKIVEGWNEGFEANVPPEKMTSLKDRIERFNAMFVEDVKQGDVISFDYLPGKGTKVTVKGVDKGTIAGKDFNDALLAIWLGAEPVGTDLKKALLSP